VKRRLENPVHVWSVSTDDPSKPVDNLSAKATNVGEMSIEEAEKTVNAKDGEVLAANSEGGIGSATEGAAKTEVQEEKPQNIEDKQGGEGLRNA
ncbi:hypothetical protein OVY35_24685, partial [Salmonella enterica subsp. enterica serovar 1,4,[5],12:i:-]|nr:hypothetical protein [Salmonella enterica subsp. enterica serovar 1,4,[5],12:i:-]